MRFSSCQHGEIFWHITVFIILIECVVNTLHTCSSIEVSGGILWSNMRWWIVCLTIISVVRDHMSTPHPSHTGTHTYTQIHLTIAPTLIFPFPPETLYPEQKRKTHIHLSFSSPPQQRWPLHLHLYSFYTHTQQYKENSSAPHPCGFASAL